MTYEPGGQYEIREWDEVYLEIDGQRLQARIYQPLGAGPFPAILNIHGGSWNHFDRRSDFYPCGQLAKSGLVVISIDFRLAPEFKYPACLQEANYAVRWAKLNAPRLKINADLLGGLGHATGAQMILLIALRPLDTLLSKIPLPGAEELDASLAFVLAPDPVFDVTARYEHIARQPSIAEWIDDTDYPRLRKSPPALGEVLAKDMRKALGLWNSIRGISLPGYTKFERWVENRLQSMALKTSTRPVSFKLLMAGLVREHELFFSTYEEMADASPLSVLFAGSAQRYPPVFAVQSADDATLILESSLAFVSAYLRVGGRIEFNPVSGLGHGFINIPSHQADTSIAAMEKFLAGVFFRLTQKRNE